MFLLFACLDAKVCVSGAFYAWYLLGQCLLKISAIGKSVVFSFIGNKDILSWNHVCVCQTSQFVQTLKP